MPNSIEYVQIFERELQQKYARELTSYALTQSNPGVKFINAKTIKIPNMTVSGYKDHNRNVMGFNTGDISTSYEVKTLAHDRDVEFAIDPMDVDESNLTAEIANVQNVFETEQAIPEKDSYRYSKLYTEAVANAAAGNGAVVDSTTVLTEANVLSWFDDQMGAMDDAGVPVEGRILYVTSAVNKMIKNAEGISRQIAVNGGYDGAINRSVHSLDDVEIKVVPGARLKTAYNFTDGCVPASGAKQINMILIHPSCVVSRDKYAYIKVFLPGSDSRTADKYVYQNRYYTDTFLIKAKGHGVAINVEA